MTIQGLGKDFDLSPIVTPVDLATAASTGIRVHMKNYGGIAFVGYLNNGTAAENPVFTFREHDAASAGNSKDLDVVTSYFKKEAATLDGSEQWEEVTQTAGDIDVATWDDANEVLFVVQIDASELDSDNGYEWVSVDVTDPGTAHVGAVLAVMYGLKQQRDPANLSDSNT